MAAPRRIQLRRTKGWRKPEGVVVVSRPTKWGNPFSAQPPGDLVAKLLAVQRFQQALWAGKLAVTIAEVKRELRGRDLACWCAPPPMGKADICHAAVLLKLANR